MSLQRPTVIVLDRDGVINEDSPNYIKTPAEWTALPGSLDAIARLYAGGFLLAIATNQSGVGRGLFSLDTLWDIHQKMLAEIAGAGGYVERIFFCLHTPEDNCDCRKPKPGLLYQAAECFACGLENMIMIGDSTRDIEAATTAGARSVLLRTGNGQQAEQELLRTNVPIYDDLSAAADALLAQRSIESNAS
jgi:D-glycero-D-manno-heptose 1,7-bisphosphate phosphatase